MKIPVLAPPILFSDFCPRWHLGQPGLGLGLFLGLGERLDKEEYLLHQLWWLEVRVQGGSGFGAC